MKKKEILLVAGFMLTAFLFSLLGWSVGNKDMAGYYSQISALQNELKQYQGNNLDPTLLELAISKELNSQDSYDIHLHYWADNLSSDYLNFEITGKAVWQKFDLSQID